MPLAYDHAACIWLLSFLAHEVGHNLDEDLKLRSPLAARLDSTLTQAQPSGGSARVPTWRSWAGEILADALALLLGGLGFALALADLLQTLAPLFGDVGATRPHPHPCLRLRLLASNPGKA